jgi:hypothetical protein
MTHILKNKADIHNLVADIGLEHIGVPDFIISSVHSAARNASYFLKRIEALYHDADLANVYPVGVVLRAAESDGNYGCCIVHKDDRHVVVVRDGDGEHLQQYKRWEEALAMSQAYLLATMNLAKEERVVISRYLDLADSPGMSVVILDGQVVSLGWNGQYQKPGSKACVGTSSYHPQDTYTRQMQQEYEIPTAIAFEHFLRTVAIRCGIDFETVRGVANIDIMLPGPLERVLQQQRGQQNVHYLAECNPRWTNYTDAIMTILGASQRDQTIQHMQSAIAQGVLTVDKYDIPSHIPPQLVREQIFDCDTRLQACDTRIICRMSTNPMGLIFAGDVPRAQQEMDAIITRLATYKHT